MKKILFAGLIFIFLLAGVSATSTSGVITFPTTGSEIGHNAIIDFNVSDDQDLNYLIKGVGVWATIGDVNVIGDYNVATGIANGSCVANDSDGNSTGQVRCQLSVSTTGIRNDGDYTLTIFSFGSDNAVDSNSSNVFSIIREYDITLDPDINKYSQKDMEDLTESGIGEAIREFAIWVGFIVLVFVIIFLIFKGKDALKKMKGQ